ncbi:MAG: ahbD [Deltaproteobacteria bacterium]|nr:ahbD [Deltaproteobacteria bacterium]
MNDELRAKNQKPGTPNSELRTDEPQLRMIAWELTRSCNLACVHCRASAAYGPYEGELSTQEVFRVMDNIASFSKPVIILTGGEPLLRPKKGSGWSWLPTGHCSMKRSYKR